MSGTKNRISIMLFIVGVGMATVAVSLLGCEAAIWIVEGIWSNFAISDVLTDLAAAGPHAQTAEWQMVYHLLDVPLHSALAVFGVTAIAASYIVLHQDSLPR